MKLIGCADMEYKRAQHQQEAGGRLKLPAESKPRVESLQATSATYLHLFVKKHNDKALDIHPTLPASSAPDAPPASPHKK